MTLREIADLNLDGQNCHRLNKWERDFLQDMAGKSKDSDELTDAQNVVLKRIEAKVYAT